MQASKQGAPRKTPPSHVKWRSFCLANHHQLRPNCGVLFLFFPFSFVFPCSIEWPWILRLAAAPFFLLPLLVRNHVPFSFSNLLSSGNAAYGAIIVQISRWS
ncbi:hypothetical protein V6N13_095040 [Hibiscus sabdariffa]